MPIKEVLKYEFTEKDFEIELLMIADHSMFEAFLELYNGDDFVAFHGLSDYLRGLFEQVKRLRSIKKIFRQKQYSIALFSLTKSVLV